MMAARIHEFDSPMPRRIVGSDGKPNFGRYCHPFWDANLDTVALAPPIPGMLPTVAYGRFRLKEWQHVLLIMPTHVLTMAWVDTRYMQLAWCQLIDRRTGQRWSYEKRGWLPRMHVARDMSNDRCVFESRHFSMSMDNQLDAGGHHINIDIHADAQRPAIRAQLRCEHDLSVIDPMVVVLPVGQGRSMYSHKVPLPVSGWLSVGSEELAVSARNTVAVLDIHKAHYPRRMWWRWATCAGHDATGRLLALNLTHNIIENDAEHNENGFWEDGRLTPLGPARFVYDAKDPLVPWRVHTLDGGVELTFIPAGLRQENVNAVVLASRFVQCYGLYSGTVRIGSNVIQLENFFGLAEIHDSLW